MGGLTDDPNIKKTSHQELNDEVQKIVDAYDPKDDGDYEEFGGEDGADFSKIAFTHADGKDYFLFALGTLAATCFGSMLPFFMMVFGGMVDGMGESTNKGFGELEF